MLSIPIYIMISLEVPLEIDLGKLIQQVVQLF
jgi:hypothetical protein